MKWTGLTGGIATGKSTAGKLIQGLGIPVIDADQIAHELSEVGQPGYNQILSQFGTEILNSDFSLNRKKLAQMVFGDAALKNKLEIILHPMVQSEVAKKREFYQKAGVEICFYDVPLLFEKKLEKNFDNVVLIWCDAETQLQRLMLRNSLELNEAMLRIQNQDPLIDKVKKSDFCIDNSGSLEDLEKQIVQLIIKIKSTQS